MYLVVAPRPSPFAEVNGLHVVRRLDSAFCCCLHFVSSAVSRIALPSTEPPPKVDFSKPVDEPIAKYEVFTGRTQAMSYADLRARVTGYLKEANFKEGEDVKKDDVLFLIDPDPYVAVLTRPKPTSIFKKHNCITTTKSTNEMSPPLPRARSARTTSTSRLPRWTPPRRRSKPPTPPYAPPRLTSTIPRSARPSAAASADASSIPATTSRPMSRSW